MSLSKAEREAGYRAIPQPTATITTILRRVAQGSLLVTLDKGDPVYCYEDGTPIRDTKGRLISSRAVRKMIRQHWLIPIEGESLFSRLSSAPDTEVPQRYRARTVEDGPLPRFTKR